jgi:hypothetical protein
MDPMKAVAAVLAAAFAAAAGAAFALSRKLAAARAESAEAQASLAAPPPPRVAESRRERYGVLWFPTLTLKDADRTVVSGAAGVPHCARCVRPLKLASAAPGEPEEWTCSGCAERRPASMADIAVTDSVVADALAEFLARHEGWRAHSGMAGKKPSRT